MTLFFPDFVAFDDPVGMGFWLTGHYYEHNAMLTFALKRTPMVLVPDYDLLAWNPDAQESRRDWLGGHQNVHLALRSFTGVSGPDFSEVNMSNQTEFMDWMQTHAFEHQQLRQVMGLQ